MKKGAFLSTVRVAFPYTVPVMAGYLVLSVAYGILMQSKGCSPVWALLVSLLAYSGSMQYAAVPYFAAPFDPLGAFVLSLTINARYFFCSMGMLDRFADAGKSRPLLFYMLSDESFAIAATTPPPPEVSSGAFYTAVFVLNYLYWGIDTLAGGLLWFAAALCHSGAGFHAHGHVCGHADGYAAPAQHPPVCAGGGGLFAGGIAAVPKWKETPAAD